ncbi:MAG: TonB family protein [Bacteroidales bacterium]|nr:TonB family protein [Bacteroidales bacterium]
MKSIQKIIFFTGIIPLILVSASTIIVARSGISKGIKEDPITISCSKPDQTLSPYFFINSDDPSVDRMPLKSSGAVVSISGVIADVTVSQEYRNEGRRPIEAVYVFPASTRAAVHSLKMIIGERTIEATIAEKGNARKQYETARQNGQTASLLEEERPNVFKMSVANIMPGDKISVVLQYTELLIPEEGVYQFVYPTVVGPRYNGSSEAGIASNTNWVSNPYTHQGIDPFYSFSMECSLHAGMPLADIRSNTHQINIQFQNPADAHITLDPGEIGGGNKDFILEYRLAGNAIQTGLLLFEGKDENFFLAMVQPPKQVKDSDIPPRDYVFIVDISGSMNGYPLEISKGLIKNLIQNLRPTDCFNVILFAGGSSMFAEHSLQATPSNLQRAIRFIESQNGGGGTELLPALRQALALDVTNGYARSFIIATDGYVTVEKQAFELVKKNRNKANFFAFGIGSSVNRYLIEGLAISGGGLPFIVTEPSLAVAEAEKFRKYVEKPVLSHITLKTDGADVYDIEPGSIQDVFSNRPVVICGKYKGNPRGRIIIEGLASSGKFSSSLYFDKPGISGNNQALPYLWARERIRNLDDFSGSDNESAKEQVTEIGLKYSLLTKYTSFIAIDSEKRNQNGDIETVNQPLPMPEGVSDMAVGTAAGNAVAPSYGSPMRKNRVYECAKTETMTDAAEAMDVEDPMMVLEQFASFPGGEAAMKTFLSGNIIIPEKARIARISGKVYISFKVRADGSIYNIRVVKGLGYGCDEEAIRLVKMMPTWNPATSHGTAIESLMYLVIDF